MPTSFCLNAYPLSHSVWQAGCQSQGGIISRNPKMPILSMLGVVYNRPPLYDFVVIFHDFGPDQLFYNIGATGWAGGEEG